MAESTRENLRRRLRTQKEGARDAARRGDYSRMWTSMLCAVAITVVLARLANAHE